MPTPAKFVWYELMTPDAKAAEAYYSHVIGWTMQDAGMPGGAYTLLSAGGHTLGGLMALPPEAAAMGTPTCWTGYIGVDDVDASAARIASRGGKVLRSPEDIPGVGRFAVVADPHGAAFIVFRGNAAEAPPAPAPDMPGSIGWHELHASDGPAAMAFYAEQFRWTQADAMDMGPMGLYQLFTTGGNAVGGIMTKMPEMPVPFWLYYINVEAIDAAAQRATAGGGKVINGPMEVPGGSWIVNCIDPQGAHFAMVAPKR